MKTQLLLALACLLGTAACTTPTRCEPAPSDSGASTGVVDAGPSPVDAGPLATEEALRFVNLTENTVTFSSGDAGVEVEPFSSSSWSERKTGHVTLNRRTISAMVSGHSSGVSFDCDYDVASAEGELHRYTAVVVAHGNQSPEGLLLRKGWDGTVKGGSKSFAERIQASLADSADALDAGIDLNGDCMADVGPHTGEAASVSVFTSESVSACARDGVSVIKAHSSINGSEVEEVSLVSDQGQPALAHRLKVWQLMQGTRPDVQLRLSAPVPDVFVLNMRSTGAAEDYSFDGKPLVTGAEPGRPVLLPPLVAHVVKTRTKSNNSNDRIMAGGTMLPLIAEAATGPCRPPYLCDFVVASSSSKHINDWRSPHLSDASARLRSSSLLVVSDTEARLIGLPDVEVAPNAVVTPYFLPIVTGNARSSASVCFGNDVSCNTNDAVSFDLAFTEVPSSLVQPVRVLPTPRVGSTGRSQFRVRVVGTQGAADVQYFTQPTTWPTSSTLFVVGPARAFDAAAAADGKVVVQITNDTRKNYVGHVTLIKQ